MASAADVVRAAQAEKSEIGGSYLSNSRSGNKYCSWFGMDGYWCAMFVSYVMNKAGIPTSVIPKYSWCQDGVDAAKSQNRLYSKSQVTSGAYTPQPGDIFFRNSDHTGIIVSVSGGSFTTIEGNTGGGGAGQRTVASHTWDFSGGSYTHIFHPNYPDTTPGGVNSTPTIAPKKTITVPSGLGKYYTYMAWDTVTNMDTLQGKLIKQAGKRYDSAGYGKIGERYTVAMTSTFGAIGDYVDIYMSGGRVIKAIIADEKSQQYAAWDHNPANKWGHENGQCIVEWVTNWKKHDNPPSDGTVVKVLNFGSYFDNPSFASGSTESYMYGENSYGTETKEPTVTWNNRVKENVSAVLNNANEIPATGELAIYVSGNNITKYAGNLAWKNSIYELSTTMTFDTPKTETAYLKDLIYVPSVGDVVQILIDEEMFRGLIVKVDDGDTDKNKYSVVDMGWYLNKTAQTYQFKSISATEAIKEICSDLNIPVDMIPELPTTIKQIYWNKKISDILKDILSKCGGDYNYDFTPKGLRIYAIGTLTAEPKFTIASNIPMVSSVDYRGGVSHSTSIEEMKNSVKITSEKDSAYTEIMVLQDRELIDKYGFLQEIVKIDPEKENAQSVAETKLAELKRPAETYSFEVIEAMNSYSRAGETLMVDDTEYVIESTDHSIKNGFHFNKISLRKIA